MSSPAEYVMTRDYIDNNRINLQHYLSREIIGYLTHPSISLLEPDIRIADVGTGTGIWLCDIANRLPTTARLDGLDVSFDAAVPKALLPSNITFYHWDIRTPVPEELAGQYDLVHVRHFSLVLQDSEMENVLGNLWELLKPGGHLQWTEPDVASFRVEKLNPTDECNAMIQLIKISQTLDKRLTPTWVPKMPEQFASCGYTEIKYDVCEAPPPLGLAMHECNLALHEIITRKIGNDDVRKQISDLLPEVCRETRKGSYMAFTRWTVVGRRPILI
ncbi:S-adenosyl-L-methionine-dependent methyltransferase [Nemania sp. FL0916]|nr:S-adenosyl-L-methionine-dependent methyltransferase [Nemania sp. FL0916]